MLQWAYRDNTVARRRYGRAALLEWRAGFVAPLPLRVRMATAEPLASQKRTWQGGSGQRRPNAPPAVSQNPTKPGTG